MSARPHSLLSNPHRLIWAIALPAMLANLATALFGIADLWIIGRIGDAAQQGGVELGAKLLLGLLTVFNFLRTGTVALTAQAIGRDHRDEIAGILLRALALSLVIGMALLALQPWLIPLALDLMGADAAVGMRADAYLGMRYLSVPAWLMGAVLTGWLIGQQRLVAILLVEVGANLVHILLDIVFVLSLGWGAAGVGAASLISEWGKFLALAALVLRQAPIKSLLRLARVRSTWRMQAILHLLQINRDLFLRTLLLIVSVLLLTRGGATAGATTLAANGIIFQLFMMATLMLDGFESPAQVLCGKAVGAGDYRRFRHLCWCLMGWGVLSSVVVALVFLLFGAQLAGTFSTSAQVIAETRAYAGWLVLLPLLGVVSFVLDGIFIGATWTRAMLITAAFGFVAYVAALYGLQGFGNHGLWMAYAILLAVRALGQVLAMPRLLRATFPAMARQV